MHWANQFNGIKHAWIKKYNSMLVLIKKPPRPYKGQEIGSWLPLRNWCGIQHEKAP